MVYAYKHLLRLAAGCIGALSLQACAPLNIRDEQAGRWVPIQAATVEIHRDIAIPGNRTRTFFQNGAQTPHINEFQPFCQLEVTTLLENGQTVHPGTFTVTQIGTRMQDVVEATPVLVVAMGGGVSIGSDTSSGPTRITRTLNFRLHSADQPDVRSLVCGGAFDDPVDADPPTIQDIATALGGYATLLVR